MYIGSGIYQPNIMRRDKVEERKYWKMITHSLVQKTVNVGKVGGTEKGKVGERKDKGWEKTWERGEKGERDRYKEWGEGRREENERIERTER